MNMSDGQIAMVNQAEIAGVAALVSLANTAHRIAYGNAPDKVKFGWLDVAKECLNYAETLLVNELHLNPVQARAIITLWTDTDA